MLESTRAPRFGLHLTMKYRAVGQTRWQKGTTENISRSGVLFQAADLLDVNTPIEMRVALPIGDSAERFSEVLCTGRIVRIATRPGEQEHPALAAAITDYRLQPGSD